MLMLYTPWFANDPWNTASAMSRLLDAPWRWPAQAATPRADVLERDDAWEILCDVPGMGPEDIEVIAEDGAIAIRGARRWDGGSSALVRSFRLGGVTPSSDVSASLANGVLRVRVPKRAASEARLIPVRGPRGERAGGGALERFWEGLSRRGRALGRMFKPRRSAEPAAS
ncbi:Hsp20/alpha crystallin family protein [Sorangium sp. So ce1024]|uniref:Hsp20/alpha crystallin family protein n=1 Tax=Sorangium sp. So ce1024 TaxID=3133327 RepID=UPI003EFEFDE0